MVIQEAHALLFLGDSVTTDHISPAGSIARNSPAARYLAARGYVVRLSTGGEHTTAPPPDTWPPGGMLYGSQREGNTQQPRRPIPGRQGVCCTGITGRGTHNSPAARYLAARGYVVRLSTGGEHTTAPPPDTWPPGGMLYRYHRSWVTGLIHAVTRVQYRTGTGQRAHQKTEDAILPGSQGNNGGYDGKDFRGRRGQDLSNVEFYD